MKIKSAYGWAIAIPGWPESHDEHWLPLLVFSTRQEAIRYECWNQGHTKSLANPGSISPWLHTEAKSISRAWKRLYYGGYRAVRVEVRAAFRKYREPAP